LSRSKIIASFPRLRSNPFYITSPETKQYNCIAWAAGVIDRWWWPGLKPFAYWPPGVPTRLHLDSFVAAFNSLGYEVCDNGAHEPGFEKVALFVDSNGVPTHAARELASGRWTSKLGPWEDIDHTIFGLEVGPYGTATQYLKRPLSDHTPQSLE
jgi:hypothetical protein